MELLKKVGEDLAVHVKEDELPTVKLEQPTIYGENTLFELTMGVFARKGLNSPILVGGTPQFTDAYFNTLALVMTQEHFSDRLRTDARMSDERAINRLIGKRLHTFQVHRFLSLSDDINELSNLFIQLVSEAEAQRYFFVIDHLKSMFLVGQDDKRRFPSSLPPLAAHFSFAVRTFKIRFVFTTALSWPDYVNEVENVGGVMHSLARYCPYIPLTPRPSD